MHWKIENGLLVINLWLNDGTFYGMNYEVKISCADIVKAAEWKAEDDNFGRLS